MRILFADDHVMMREALRPHIEAIADDVEVVETGSLHQVFDLLETGDEFGLLLLDLKMPGMSGLDGLAQLRQRYPDLRVVIISSTTDPEKMAEALWLGAVGFIPKHLSTRQMHMALQLVLSGEVYAPPSAFIHPERMRPGHNPWGKLLTPREMEVARLLREGLPNKLIAVRLGLSEVTVKTHLSNLFRKLKVSNRVQAVRHIGPDNLN